MRALLGIAAGVIFAIAIGAASTTVGTQTAAKHPTKALIEKDLDSYAGNGLMLNVAEITFPPGATSTKHRHPGPTFVYVLQGAIEIELEGAAPKVYRAGDSFYEEPHQLHVSTRNVSETEPAKILAYQLSHKGEALTTPEK